MQPESLFIHMTLVGTKAAAHIERDTHYITGSAFQRCMDVKRQGEIRYYVNTVLYNSQRQQQMDEFVNPREWIGTTQRCVECDIYFIIVYIESISIT